MNQIIVFSIAGKQLIQINEIQSVNTTINLQSLTPGSYFIQIKDVKGNFKTEKIIKTTK